MPTQEHSENKNTSETKIATTIEIFEINIAVFPIRSHYKAYYYKLLCYLSLVYSFY